LKSSKGPKNNLGWNSQRVLKGLGLFIVAWSVLAWIAAQALIVSAPLASADVLVVLSGSSAYLERTHKAAEVFRQGRAPLVLLSDDNTRGGWSSAQQRNPYFVERARDELIKEGVPAEKIRIVPGLALSTRDEALLLKEYVLAQGFKSILVVTSGYHSRRALRSLRQSFAGTGITIGLEPAPIGSSTPYSFFWWLQPAGWRNVGGEYVKLIYYWFKYG
jgi:uncharacterized SAM-binding protein YcdF (DUF218 family)